MFEAQKACRNLKGLTKNIGFLRLKNAQRVSKNIWGHLFIFHFFFSAKKKSRKIFGAQKVSSEHTKISEITYLLSTFLSVQKWVLYSFWAEKVFSGAQKGSPGLTGEHFLFSVKFLKLKRLIGHKWADQNIGAHLFSFQFFFSAKKSPVKFMTEKDTSSFNRALCGPLKISELTNVFFIFLFFWVKTNKSSKICWGWKSLNVD